MTARSTADILNPTDRFAPRDFLQVTGAGFLGVTAARATYERGSGTLDLVWAPRFTPSRTSLLNQRWAVLPEPIANRSGAGCGCAVSRPLAIRGPLEPGAGREYSISFYDGFNHLPLFTA